LKGSGIFATKDFQLYPTTSEDLAGELAIESQVLEVDLEVFTPITMLLCASLWQQISEAENMRADVDPEHSLKINSVSTD